MKQGKIRSIAIVSSGLSGLITAYILNQKYKVTLYDISQEVGGIYNSKVIQDNIIVDIVHNSINYSLSPYLVQLLSHLHIRLNPIKSSFSISFEKV